jgi:hypothetical protein
MSKASVFARASTEFNAAIHANLLCHLHTELGERVWCAFLAENASDTSGRQQALSWRCKDAGVEDE